MYLVKKSFRQNNTEGDSVLEAGTNDEIRKPIIKETLTLPACWEKKLAFVLHNVLTPEECEAHIQKTEEIGYEKALVNIGLGRQMLLTDVRNSSRCIVDSTEEVDKLWERIKEHIPSVWRQRRVMGLNERLRFLKYDPGEYFKPHYDGNYKRDNGEISFMTVLVYLNEGYKGGQTAFLHSKENERTDVIPKTGSVLIFQHDIFHEGSLLTKGRKYVVRTDVMYSANRNED